VRVCVVGGGLAGTLLTWRLAQRPEVERVDLLTGGDTSHDATEVSGGVVRAYEPLPEQRRLAVESLVELSASAVLRDWAGFRPGPSLYLRTWDPGVDAALRQLDRARPGSARLLGGSELDAMGWAGLPYGTVGVLEQGAGQLSPSRLRGAVLADLTMRSSVGVSSASLDSLLARVDGTVAVWASGRRAEYDIAIVAAGAWTPRVLVANGLSARDYRTRSIQYTVYQTLGWRPPAFVDETTGLYGKPAANDGFLLGVATREWDVVPGPRPVTAEVHARARALVSARLPWLTLGPARASVNATDCYCQPPVLALRSVPSTAGAVLTFTGGSGGSARTALAASRAAADQLVRQVCRSTSPGDTSTRWSVPHA
jgi:glycine/D-amino acid oxidase-like deaminating enzyme